MPEDDPGTLGKEDLTDDGALGPATTRAPSSAVCQLEQAGR